MDWTYFSTTEKAWNVFRGLPSHIFDGVNTAFVQQQMAQGKEFVSSIAGSPGPGFLLERRLLQLWGYLEYIDNPYSSIFTLPK